MVNFQDFFLLIRVNFSPESLGVVSGFIFLVTMVLFIPVAFGNNLLEKGIFPYDEVSFEPPFN